ncbi:phosphate propanoyltransferase [Lutispora thermophila]|uniref:Phosphate propanoyltransferase n=1 Tax=Lutispora thermophila DSM 19022 TaxID=1122184 RepID=A0A1M6FIW8_9FIRM|nr:phosphate propanoyltransferase [Lutispora thermophila]SHI97660.1 Propanediol utilization protein [Lutispora thermophila DSM 19022]
MDRLELIVEKVLKKIEESKHIPVETSARHVHLSKGHVDILFGEGYELEMVRELSQPGQYVCKERVDIIGPKNIIRNVAILGPVREDTQIEISRTDSISLGINAPLRLSGDLKDSETLYIRCNGKIIEVPSSTIVAKRHIHMTPEDGRRFGVEDKQIVKVRIGSPRPVIFEDVVIRISNRSRLSMHIDHDEANACGFFEGVVGEIMEV